MHVLHGLAKAAGPANLDLLDSLFAQAKVNALVTGRSLLSAHRCSKDRPGQASKEKKSAACTYMDSAFTRISFSKADCSARDHGSTIPLPSTMV